MSIDSYIERFEQRISIASEDIDVFEHVNNVVYVRWIQEVSTAHWYARASEAEKETIGWFVVRHEIDYLNSAWLGDEIIGRTWVGAAQKNLFERHAEFIRLPDNKVIACSRSLWCPIDLRSLRPMRVGPDIYKRFSAPQKSV